MALARLLPSRHRKPSPANSARLPSTTETALNELSHVRSFGALRTQTASINPLQTATGIINRSRFITTMMVLLLMMMVMMLMMIRMMMMMFRHKRSTVAKALRAHPKAQTLNRKKPLTQTLNPLLLSPPSLHPSLPPSPFSAAKSYLKVLHLGAFLLLKLPDISEGSSVLLISPSSKTLNPIRTPGC